MNGIKFSHIYEKMPENLKDLEATLLEVLFVGSKNELSQAFINYDTEYHAYNHFEQKTEIKQYPLPNGALIILILMVTQGINRPMIFTTIRRHTPEKEKYYRSLRGQQFRINIVKDE